MITVERRTRNLSQSYRIEPSFSCQVDYVKKAICTQEKQKEFQKLLCENFNIPLPL